MEYNVNEIYACIQGEGINTGIPMVIVRLQGCNLRCSWCDTKYTWTTSKEQQLPGGLEDIVAKGHNNPLWARLTSEDIARRVAQIAPATNWVMVTGGEPLLQDISELVDELQWTGYKVAIETNGTQKFEPHVTIRDGVPTKPVYPDHICVSPKLDVPGGDDVDHHITLRADEFKFVITEPSDISRVEDFLKSTPRLKGHAQILLQPVMGEGDFDEILQSCMLAILQRGWRLSVQVHKLLDLP